MRLSRCAHWATVFFSGQVREQGSHVVDISLFARRHFIDELLELLMESKKLIWAVAIAQVMIFSGVAHAQQPAVIAQRAVSQPYEVAQGTFIKLTLESVDPDYVSAMLYENVYDDYENVAIPIGSRLFGRQINKVNDSHDVYFTQLQLSSTGQTLILDPPLKATSPLGAARITNFKPAAIAATIWRRNQVMPH